jgi:quinol monooxygenase YgiN
MYNVIITFELQPGARKDLLERWPALRAASRAKPGCIAAASVVRVP